ncbi:MAG: hypothetical protein EAZ60_16540 [Oscillatoriales cyanobacterium]|nr:MAG: hypothetical protein EAZ83_05195 [Oscillatoriales cyanobacterium]TAE93871.1 MAG: hypothetical protein EAZ79_25620 [Oscillatoriales cyanobacterium]TAF22721.1 MAG: hypothetical protein EAZ73_03935 [Oscillatoriales cyanobacterium]TAF36257.1 MAG: hypothetical protein EAZ69_11085 [Oscillatoriales cyanobacterium]TAF54487.1 MAG: hypothetical protein EAZ60_16540 [Oscillatoriales cyanobacterium]
MGILDFRFEIVIPILKNNATVFFPRNTAGGLGGVEECCTILEKWYKLGSSFLKYWIFTSMA